MEIPIQVAVRLSPIQKCSPNYIQFLPPQPIHYHKPMIKVNNQTFPVNHVQSSDCSQTAVFFNTVYPLIGSFMEGCDVSVVMYGQKETGKTYTLFGPGFDCIYSESEQGIFQRCVREIFAQIANYSQTRSFTLNIGWLELIGEQINDLLDGMIPISSVGEAFQWLQMGLANRNAVKSHSFLSLTLEQKWITPDGLIQHRLSTFSFCDLLGMDHSANDLGLAHLNKIVRELVETTDLFKTNVNYNQTILTTMMKDSFGGRAQTLLFLCLSPNIDDVDITLSNLKFAAQVQCVRNFVIMNTFSDNNTPAHVEPYPENELDTFGLQFAASQWLKLLANAEGLFKNLMTAKNLSDTEREQIEEWIFLKSECEDCLSSGEVNIAKLKPLVPIEETEEVDDEETDDQDANKSDNESDSELPQCPDFEEKIENLMSDFRTKTDNIVQQKYEDFKKSHPKAIFDSNENFNLGGRRKSLQPGSNLSSIEIDMLNKVAKRETGIHAAGLDEDDELLDSSVDLPLAKPKDNLKHKISKIESDIEATKRQMKELEHTITLKQKLIADYIRNNDTRTTAKQRFNKKKNKLESEYEKTKKALSKAIVNNTNPTEVERLKSLTSHLECRLQDLASIKHIAGENGQNLKKIQKSLQESQKQHEGLSKSLKKQIKLLENYENQLKEEKAKEKNSTLFRGKKNNLREVAARISHLDHVLKEKSQTLEKYSENGEKESLRHEIRNLRRTRDYLIEQRCQLVKKLKKEKLLSNKEERKLLECDEAIEAIDAAIEYKNELICGQKSIDTNEKLQKEKGERMLMARLNNLSTDEMRTLIYKYFQKVIDLRESSRKLEIHVLELERERDAWEWREKVLSNAVRQARLEGERNAVLLQRQHETKLTLMLRHLADETSTNSSMTEHFLPPTSHHHHHHQLTEHFSEQDLDIYKPKNHHMRQNQVDLYPMPSPDQYKPLDKFKGKERETKNKLFQKIQLLARYHGSSDKRKIHDVGIPHENLKHLQPSTAPVTKVTREKNKIIIQQNPSR